MQSIVQGIQDYIECAKMTGEPFNALLNCLCCMTGMSSGYTTAYHSHDFNFNFKGQVALYLLLQCVSSNPTLIQEWNTLIHVVQQLYFDDYITSESPLEELPLNAMFFTKKQQQTSSGLFSTLQNYFNIQSPTTEEGKTTHYALKCLNECHIVKSLLKCDINLYLPILIEYSIDPNEELNSFAVFTVYLILQHHNEELFDLNSSNKSLLYLFLKHVESKNQILLLYACQGLLNGQSDIILIHQVLNVIDKTDFLSTLQYLKPIIPLLHDQVQFLEWFERIPQNLTMISHYQMAHEFLFKATPLMKNTTILVPVLSQIIVSVLEKDVKLTSQYLDVLYHATTFVNMKLVFQCLNKCIYSQDADIRQKSFFYLQRMVSVQLTNDNYKEYEILFEWLFETFNFKVLDDIELLDELRMRAAAILCKTFLLFSSTIKNWENEETILIKMIRVMRTYYKSQTMIEIVPEAIKNIVLIMIDGNRDMDRIWKELEFIPNLKQEMLSSEYEETIEESVDIEDSNKKDEDAVDPSKPLYV